MHKPSYDQQLKIVSIFLGISIFLFGILKFVNPFQEWYSSQIILSGMPKESYWLGIFSEILVGLAFIVPFLGKKFKISFNNVSFLLGVASIGLVLIMFVAIYVYMQASIPSEVLPLKIKPPLIPGIFAFISFIYLYNLYRKLSNSSYLNVTHSRTSKRKEI